MRRLSESEKAELWDRFEAGESLRSISRRFGSPTVDDPDPCGVWRVPEAVAGWGVVTDAVVAL